MKRFLIAAIFTAGMIGFSTEVLAEPSSGIGLPNFYGRIDVGGYPQPQVIYREPRSIQSVPNNQPPVYMRVPRDHRRNWRNNCGQYNACNQRVLFVNDNWYKNKYAPRYQEQHRDNGRNDNNRGNNDNRGHGRNH